MNIVHLILWANQQESNKSPLTNPEPVFENLGHKTKAYVCHYVHREVGIECQEVPGHSKGIGYRQGQSLKNVKSDHLWNAVLLEGQWFLLDACWGAGRVDMEHESFIKRFDFCSYNRSQEEVFHFLSFFLISEAVSVGLLFINPAASRVSNQSTHSICCLPGLMISISWPTLRSSSSHISLMRRNGSSWTHPSLWKSLRERSLRRQPSSPRAWDWFSLITITSSQVPKCSVSFSNHSFGQFS